MPAPLSRMQASALRLMPDSCAIQEAVTVPDGAGSWSENWLTVREVPCRVDPLARPEAVIVAGRESQPVRYLLTVPFDAPLQAGRRVLHNGTAYEIRALVDDQTQPVYRQAIIGRLD